MSNIDIEIRDGNPVAIGIRFHVANIPTSRTLIFVLAPEGGIEEVGNERKTAFLGGEFGITMQASPSWPFLLIDSSLKAAPGGH